MKKKVRFTKRSTMQCNIPQITETTVDKFFLVKLFLNSSPVPLPEWFRKGSDCRLKRKSVLENFPNYIRNFQETKNIPSDILNELQEIHFKKPVDRVFCKSFTLGSVHYVCRRRAGGFYKFFKKIFVTQETIDVNISWPSNYFRKYFMDPPINFSVLFKAYLWQYFMV